MEESLFNATMLTTASIVAAWLSIFYVLLVRAGRSAWTIHFLREAITSVDALRLSKTGDELSEVKTFLPRSYDLDSKRVVLTDFLQFHTTWVIPPLLVSMVMWIALGIASIMHADSYIVGVGLSSIGIIAVALAMSYRSDHSKAVWSSAIISTELSIAFATHSLKQAEEAENALNDLTTEMADLDEESLSDEEKERLMQIKLTKLVGAVALTQVKEKAAERLDNANLQLETLKSMVADRFPL